MTKVRQFYVYILRDPRPGKNLQPIYVGKGYGRRARTHFWHRSKEHRNKLLAHILGKIREADLEPPIEVVRHFDIEAEAFRYEIELIAKYGRRDLGAGPLCNLTDGGEGAVRNLIAVAAARKFHSDPEVKNAYAERGRKRFADPEFKARMIARLQAFYAERRAFWAERRASCISGYESVCTNSTTFDIGKLAMPRGGARSKSGPERQYENRIMLKLTTEMLDAIDSIVREGETRSEVMRRALEREVIRCLKIHAKAGGRTAAHI